MGNVNPEELDALLGVLRKHQVASFKVGDIAITLDPFVPAAAPERPLEGTAAKDAAEREERALMYRSSEG